MDKKNNAIQCASFVLTVVLLASLGMPTTSVSAQLPTSTSISVGNVAITSSNPATALNAISSGVTSASTLASGAPLANPTSTTITTSATNANIILDNVQSTSGSTSALNQITLSNFTVGTENNRLLVVGVSANNNNAVSVTFGGMPLKQAVSSFNNNDAEFWYLTNPVGTANIVVTMAGATDAVVGAYVFSGVDQTNPIPTTATSFAAVSGSPSISIITKYPKGWVLDLPAIYGGVTLGSPTCTQQWNVNIPNTITGASSSRVADSPAVVTCNWVASSGDLWDDVAIELKAAGSSILGINIGVAPSPPTNLVTNTVSNSQIDLSWTAPSSNSGDLLVTGYEIERSTDNGNTWSTIVSNTGSTSTAYSDRGLAASTTYTYRVSAINAVGTSSPSNTASASTDTATVPQPPTELTATAVSSSQINLSWTTPSNNGGSAITGYNIERSTDNGTTWSSLSNTTSTSYSDTGLSSNTTYTYRVSAINAVGTSSPSNTASASTGSPSTVPQPPTGLAATAVSSSQIDLSWTVPSNDGGSKITGYEIERSTDNGNTWSIVVTNTGSNGTAYSDTGLTGSTTYTYRVSAINAVGTSSPSNTASATTQVASTGITVYAHRIPASYWDPCFAATCSAGTGPGVTMYFVLYDSAGNVVQTGFANEDGYTFSGLNSSNTYYVYPTDCDNCHGSPHDVVFQYWGDNHSNVRPRAAVVGDSLHAWYSCTNNCIDGP